MKKIINKYQEIISYLIIGVLTTLVSLGVYYALVSTILDPNNQIELQIANITSWVISVIFAYITNRIIVFKSKNTNIIKEITKFTTSRLVTLILDMAIMFFGVSILKYNDKIIKLISQFLVIIGNYLISKLFVFQNKESNSHYSITLVNLLFLFPIIDFLTSMFAWLGINIWVGSIIKGSLFLVMLISLLKEPKERKFIFILGIYFLIEIIYCYANQLSILSNGTMLLKTFLLPVMILYFSHNHNSQINRQFLVKIFYIYLLLLVIPYFLGIGHNISEIYPNKEAYLSFFYSGNELSATLLCLLPVVLDTLKKHHNWLIKLLGIFLIIIGFALLKTKTLIIGFIISVIYLLFKNRQKKANYFVVIPCFIIIACALTLTLVKNFDVALKYYEIDEPKEVLNIEFIDKVILSSRLTYLKDLNEYYLNSEPKTIILGLGNLSNIPIKETEMDPFDIYYSLGVLGFVVYLLTFIHALRKTKLTGVYAFGFYLTILVSFLTGHILTSAVAGIWLGCLTAASKNQKEKPRILMVSNMFPSKKSKHYGSFVKNMGDILTELDYDVDYSVMYKHQNKLRKLIAYFLFYIKTFIKSLVNSYDLIYVHFISHSTLPVLFGHYFTTQTKLILNAHGNDVVKDYNFEEKNIERSRRYIKVADYLVVSSHYFQKRVANDYNYPLEKIFVLPAGGVDLNRFYPINKEVAKEKIGISKDTFLIGMISRIEKNKGYDTLLEALYMLKEEPFMENTKLLIVGTGSEQKRFNALVKKYHLESYIIQKDFVYQEELINYYNAFDIFVFPTKRESESLGLVGLEAMACKTLVIGCDLYGPSEYLINKENSLTYQKTNGLTLARKIREARKLTMEEKNKIITNAYQTAQEFSKEKTKITMKEMFGEKL